MSRRTRPSGGERSRFVRAGGTGQNLTIDITNLGDRPVTINSVGWAIGKGKNRRYCVQPVHGPFTSQYPVELAHGKTADFMVSFLAMPIWLDEFAKGFVQDLSDRSLKTLVALLQTSVGHMVEVRPEPGLRRRLKEFDGTGQQVLHPTPCGRLAPAFGFSRRGLRARPRSTPE